MGGSGSKEKPSKSDASGASAGAASGAGSGPSSPEMTERDNMLWELKDMVAELKTKEDTVEKMKQALRATTKSRSKRREEPNLETMSLEKMQELQITLEREIEELREEEVRLNQEQMKGSIYFQRAAGKAAAVSALSGATRSAPRSGGGGLSAEELALLTNPDCLVGQEYKFGLTWDETWAGSPMGPRDENMRRSRREGTKRKVAEEIGLRYFGESAWSAKKPQVAGVNAFIDRTPASKLGNAPAGGKYLLGRFDVVVAKVSADLDRNWSWIKGGGRRRDFWVAHAAALNIGESAQAADFPDYTRQDNEADAARWRLDDERYLEDMEHILGNVCHACDKLKVQHLVFFPFGMGAFIRHLGQLDQRFMAPQELQRLRRRLARSFIKVLARGTSEAMRIHLCLMFTDPEPQCNADAFLRALAGNSGEPGVDSSDADALRHRVTIHIEGDSLQLAQDLADSSPNVMLVNGANRALLGNHWFAGRAKLAIDENLHRRSWRMAATSYLLNGFDGKEPWDRNPDDLKRNAEWLRGKVHNIDRLAEWF